MSKTFFPAARYFPLDKPLYEVAPALKTFGTDLGNGVRDSQVMQIDESFPRARANKLACRAERLGKYFCTAGLEPKVEREAVRFIRDRILQDYAEFFTWQDDVLHCALTDDRLAFDPELKLLPHPLYVSALDALLNQIPEDLGILISDVTAGSDQLVALHLTSPSHWAAEDKIGKGFFAIHAPIPGVEKMNRAAPALVDAMINKGPYVRFVWGFASDDRLNHHPVPPPGDNAEDWHGRSFARERPASPFLLRVERQVIWGLPKINASLFFIRVSFIEGAEFRGESVRATAERERLVGAIRSMSPASLIYKGLDRCRDDVIAWLEEKS